MCVIAICDSTRPTPEQVSQMWARNSDGGGIAWRENGLVMWEKGLDLTEMQAYCAELPFPFIAHFRLTSVGGSHDILTHPYTIDEFEKSLDIQGSTPGRVMFHNGHWNPWKENLMNTAANFRSMIPVGRWTDTRAMAWMAKFYGSGLFEVLTEKVVVFTPDDIEVFQRDQWKVIDGMVCSNSYWVPTVTTNTNYQQHAGFGSHNGASSYRMCRYKQCTEENNLLNGYCPLHPNGAECLSPTKPAIVRLREAEIEQAAIVAGVLLSKDRVTSKKELKRLRKQCEGIQVGPALLPVGEP